MTTTTNPMSDTSKEPRLSEQTYPCAECGTLRTKAEGGTTFTVCDECWEKSHPAEEKRTLTKAQAWTMFAIALVFMLLATLFANEDRYVWATCCVLAAMYLEGRLYLSETGVIR